MTQRLSSIPNSFAKYVPILGDCTTTFDMIPMRIYIQTNTKTTPLRIPDDALMLAFDPTYGAIGVLKLAIIENQTAEAFILSIVRQTSFPLKEISPRTCYIGRSIKQLNRRGMTLKSLKAVKRTNPFIIFSLTQYITPALNYQETSKWQIFNSELVSFDFDSLSGMKCPSFPEDGVPLWRTKLAPVEL